MDVGVDRGSATKPVMAHRKAGSTPRCGIKATHFVDNLESRLSRRPGVQVPWRTFCLRAKDPSRRPGVSAPARAGATSPGGRQLGHTAPGRCAAPYESDDHRSRIDVTQILWNEGARSPFLLA